MKKSIVLAALVSILSITGAFASAPVDNKDNNRDINNEVTIYGLNSNIGVVVSTLYPLNEKAVIEIADNQGNQLCKTVIRGNAGEAKAFDLSELDYGDYFVSVSIGKQEVKKQIHIYNEDGKKTWFLFQ